METSIGKQENIQKKQMDSIWERVAFTIQKCVVKAFHPGYFK